MTEGDCCGSDIACLCLPGYGGLPFFVLIGVGVIWAAASWGILIVMGIKDPPPKEARD